jgi:hypothetical protein
VPAATPENPASVSAAFPAAAALLTSPAAAPDSGADRTSGEETVLRAAKLFDGAVSRTDGSAPVSAVNDDQPDGKGWNRGTFRSADGLDLVYKRRAGPAGAIPRVYSGGLALNESFDPLFARATPPARSEYFLWTRGHPPTGWTPTSSVLDADARDLAKMIVVAAQETGSPKVELALHSFGTVVFQRMSQLRAEPEVRKALKLLSGSRVVMLNGMTHYDDVEKLGGPSVVQMAQATGMLVKWLNYWDELAAKINAFLNNPFFAMQAQAWLSTYRYERNQLLELAAKGAIDAMRADLKAPWSAESDPIRLRLQKQLDQDSKDPGWQEALLKRSHGSFALDFKTADARFLRRYGVKLELVHALGDQLLNWQAAQLLFERLGIKTPAAPPAAGTVLTDPSGTFSATVVDADHYYPMKQPGALARRLDP